MQPPVYDTPPVPPTPDYVGPAEPIVNIPAIELPSIGPGDEAIRIPPVSVRVIPFEISPRDPAVYAIVTAVILAAAVAACWIPAARAARVDPSIALRAD